MAPFLCVSSSCRCGPRTDAYCASTGTCENLNNDRDHCGACGAVCPAGLLCSLGRCVCPAPTGRTYCAVADVCADLRFDPMHCGACGAACPSGTTCTSSACRCVDTT